MPTDGEDQDQLRLVRGAAKRMSMAGFHPDSTNLRQQANTSNHSIPLTKSKSIPRKEVIQTSTALSRGHLVAMAETDIAVSSSVFTFNRIDDVYHR